jgi:hypothetical protein
LRSSAFAHALLYSRGTARPLASITMSSISLAVIEECLWAIHEANIQDFFITEAEETNNPANNPDQGKVGGSASIISPDKRKNSSLKSALAEPRSIIMSCFI